MTAKEIYAKGLDRMRVYPDVSQILKELENANEGAVSDVLNINGNAYYQWITALVDVLKPKQIVELGGAMGIWSQMVLHSLPKDSKLYSVTLAEGGLEFAFMSSKPENFIPIVGNDLDTDIWPDDTDLFATNIWFFDSLHEPTHLRKELELYEMFFKKGTILLFDDIHSFGLEPVWEETCSRYNHFDATDPLHYSGYGICIV